MIRVYSSTGIDVLRPIVGICGGILEGLATDSKGGCFACFPNADRGIIPLLKSISGILVVPSNQQMLVPQAAVNILPPEIGILVTDTVSQALSKIYAYYQNPHYWDPNHF